MLGQGLRWRARFLHRSSVYRCGAVCEAHRRDGAGPRDLGYRLAASQREGDAERRRSGRSRSVVRGGARTSAEDTGDQSGPAVRVRSEYQMIHDMTEELVSEIPAKKGSLHPMKTGLVVSAHPG